MKPLEAGPSLKDEQALSPYDIGTTASFQIWNHAKRR